jgi:hypothetical protein
VHARQAFCIWATFPGPVQHIFIELPTVCSSCFQHWIFKDYSRCIFCPQTQSLTCKND